MENQKLSIDKNQIRDEIKKLKSLAKTVCNKEQIGLLTLKTGNQWLKLAKDKEIPKMLFSEFWFETELCILFADTNLGKSILGVQIADSISRGIPIRGLKLECIKQKVLYLDFEMSDKQFENRYSDNYTNHYSFDENFIRVEINADAEIPEEMSFEAYLNESLEKSIIEHQVKILIIDNLTYLRAETEKAKDAMPLMKQLKSLKKKYGLSILALAHTPKRDLSKPLTKNDLQGSKMLINFCDSSFAIGESISDKNLRYIKQIKQRNTCEIYGSENVCICEIEKPTNFLQFEYLSLGNEKEHLKQPSETDNTKLAEKVLELKNHGKSYRDIGVLLGISHMKAKRLIDIK